MAQGIQSECCMIGMATCQHHDHEHPQQYCTYSFRLQPFFPFKNVHACLSVRNIFTAMKSNVNTKLSVD